MSHDLVIHDAFLVDGSGVGHLVPLAAGTLSGAPKPRALEIIDELETVPRGLYCGAMGYLGFNGECQMNIVIRTLIRENDQLHYHVGAGIVADSSPEMEYEETLHKAAGIRLAVMDWQQFVQSKITQ